MRLLQFQKCTPGPTSMQEEQDAGTATQSSELRRSGSSPFRNVMMVYTGFPRVGTGELPQQESSSDGMKPGHPGWWEVADKVTQEVKIIDRQKTPITNNSTKCVFLCSHFGLYVLSMLETEKL